jgi:site-specific DNA-methyltransferase (adenine-specific)
MKFYYADDAVVIYHGDCRELLPLMPKVDLVLTDPPYGVGKAYGSEYDDDPESYWAWFLPTLALIRAAAPVVAMHHRPQILKVVTDWDWVGIWHKPLSFGSRIGNSPVLPYWEPILLWGIHTLGNRELVLPDVISAVPEAGGAAGSRDKGNGHKAMGREAHSLVGGAPHPAPKPLALMRHLVAGLSVSNSTVLDPFLGSGTTARAAKDLGRKCIGIEIEERYAEIAARRMAQTVLDLTSADSV